MQASDIRELGDDEIRQRIGELEEERFRLRFRSATEAIEQPLTFRMIRRDVARLKTVLRERELGLARGDGAAGSARAVAPTSARSQTPETSTGPRSPQKTTARKPAAGKTTGRRTATRKTSTRKGAANRTSGKKTGATRAAAKKPSTKTGTRKTAARKGAADKAGKE
jgi:large subunit ribosomal protein L29